MLGALLDIGLSYQTKSWFLITGDPATSLSGSNEEILESHVPQDRMCEKERPGPYAPYQLGAPRGPGICEGTC